MTRPTRPGSIQDVVKAAYKATGGIEAVSSQIGVACSTLSYATELRDDRPGGLGVNHLDRLARIEPGAARPVAQHFAQLAGGVFTPLDLTGMTAADIHAIAQKFANALACHAEAHSVSSEDPMDYTQAEALKQIQELNELIEATAAFRALLLPKAGIK